MPATRPFIHRRPRTNVPHRRTYRGRRYCALLATIHTCIAAQVTAFPSNMEHGPRATALEARFDTNSFTLGLDGHSSRCMSPHRSQFTNLQPWNGPKIKGIGTAPIEGQENIKLPKYFPVETDKGMQCMKRRKPLALRLHKFKRRENAHEFYYSEMQLYFYFEKEEIG